MPTEERILEFPVPVRPMRNARSTVLLSSMAVLRDSPRWTDYLAVLPKEHHSSLLEAVAGTWIPVEIAMAHYNACGSLGLTPEQETLNGRKTLERSGQTIFGTIINMSKAAGVTPWTLLPHLQRFWDRIYDGGGIAVVKLGPKEARIDVVQARIVDCRYFRNAIRGLYMALMEMYCSKVYMHERVGARQPGTMAFRLQWV